MSRLKKTSWSLFVSIFTLSFYCVASETFQEQVKVYGIIKPGKITTLVGVNQGIVQHIEQVGTKLNTNEPAIQVLERELTRGYRTTISGIVSKNHVTAGAAVTPGMPLVTIIDPEAKDVEVSLSPSEARKIKVGSPVFAKDQEPFGVVSKISPLVDIDTGAVISYVKPNRFVNSLIGDVLPLFVNTRTITDCDRIVQLNELDSSLQQMSVEAYSGNKACLKSAPQARIPAAQPEKGSSVTK